MTYQITVESPHHATVTFARKRRDSAEYLFRRSVCRNVWPRDCVRSKRGTYGQTKIVAPYDWRSRLGLS